jgi:ubiquitin
MSEETMTPEQGSGELTVNEAATAFEGFLSAGEESNDQPETVEAEAQEEVVEEVDESGEEEVVADESVESEDEEEYEEEEPEEAQRFTVKAAGEEKEVTLEELMQGYQLGADYTKKTQEVAEQRKAVEAEAKAVEEAKQVRDTYAQRLQAIEQFLTSGEDSPEDLAAMKENDPIGYAVKVAEMTEKKEQLTQVRAEQQRLAQQQQAERQQNMAKFVQEEATKLSQVLPEFSDPTKGEQIRNEIRNYGKNVGFTDNELAQVYDSRHVLILHKAMMYDKLQKSKPNVNKKVAQAPKMVKSGTKVKEGSRDLRKQQMNKLKQTGKARDAAALFENFIN